MKNPVIPAIILFIASTSTALANTNAEKSGLSLITILFLVFFGLIIATQLFPGLFLFITGVKSLFSKRPRHATPKR